MGLWRNEFYELCEQRLSLIEYFVVTEQKNVLNKLAISLGEVTKESLSFITLGISGSLHFKEIIFFMSFQMFLKFLILVLK